jgi:hypothetical protein
MFIYINFERFLRSNIVKKLYFLVVLNALWTNQFTTNFCILKRPICRHE